LATVEGATAVEDALHFLSRQEALKPIIHEDEDYQSPCSAFLDQSPDPSPRQGVKNGKWCQFCWFGPGNITARKIVEDLIIDDGCIERKHRLAIFNPLYHSIRIRCRQRGKGRTWVRFNFSMSTFTARAKPGRLCGRCAFCDQLRSERQASANLSSTDGSLASDAQSSTPPSRPPSGETHTTSASSVGPPRARTPGSQEVFFNTWPGVVHSQAGARLHKGSTLRRSSSAGSQRTRPSVQWDPGRWASGRHRCWA